MEGIYWNGSPLGHYDLGLGPPPITLFTWDDDSSSPFPAKPDSFYLEYDALYSVLAGNVSVNGNPTPLMVGDQYYARAGTKHGLVPLTPGAMVIFVGVRGRPRMVRWIFPLPMTPLLATNPSVSTLRG